MKRCQAEAAIFFQIFSILQEQFTTYFNQSRLRDSLFPSITGKNKNTLSTSLSVGLMKLLSGANGAAVPGSTPAGAARGLVLPLPECCMDAEGLFMGEATLRKILCLQETLRGVAGGGPLTESLLQVDRVLLRPSPLLQDHKRLGCHPVRHQYSFTRTHTLASAHTHTYTHAHTSSFSSVSSGLFDCLQTARTDETGKGKHSADGEFHVADTMVLMKQVAVMGGWGVAIRPPHAEAHAFSFHFCERGRSG